MNAFTYYMPAKVLFGKDCVMNNKEEFWCAWQKGSYFYREDARQN